MATSFPTALDTATEQPSPGSTTNLDQAGFEHDVIHTNHSGALIAVETKMGTGASNAASATAGHVLTHSSGGATAWAATAADATKLPLTGGAMTGAITTNSTFDGVDIAVRDAILTSTTTTAGAALPKAGGTMTGAVVGLVAPLAINAQTGTTYTFVLADAGKLVTSSNGSAQTITVPPNSGVAFAIGTQIIVQNIGSANATLATAGTPTLNSKDSNLEIDGQFAAATLIKTATDAWSIIGALA